MDFLEIHFSALIIMAVLLACSAFFSGSETALFTLSRETLHRFCKQDDPAGEKILELARHPGELLFCVLFGNMLVNVSYFCTGAGLASQLSEEYGGWVEAGAGVGILGLIILGGEVMPKAIAVSHPESISLRTASSLRLWFRICRPLRAIYRLTSQIPERGETRSSEGGKVTNEELKKLLSITSGNRLLPLKEKEIIEDIVYLSEARVHELMTPRVDVLFESLEAAPATLLKKASEQRVGAVPIYKGQEDNIIGVVRTRELFLGKSKMELKDFLHPVKFIPETKKADEMLSELTISKNEMVVVVDEYGGLAGVLTLEDLLEEVVEHLDDDIGVEELSANHYRLSGQLPAREWQALFRTFLTDEEMNALALDTVAGLVISLLGQMPREGDVVRLQNIVFTVEEMHNHRIRTILLELIDPETQEEAN